MTTDNQVIEAVRKHATDYFNCPGTFTWDLEKQGFKPEHYADWNIQDERVIVTIKSVFIKERDDAAWLASVNAEPEIPDEQLFECAELDNGTLVVQWHGC